MAEAVNNMVAVRATHAAGTTTSETYTMMRPAIAYDLVLIATNGGAGTVTLRNGANAISVALNPASTDTRVSRSATGVDWIAARKTLAVGDVLTFAVSASTLAYEAYAYLYSTPGYLA